MGDNQLSAQDRDAILASVIAASLDCIVVIDEPGCAVEFNPAAEQTFGYPREEALGRPIAELIIPPHHRAAHAHGFARYLAGGEPRVIGHRVEVEAQRRDGTCFPVELAITEVAALDGRRLFTASLRDLSERKQAQAALETAQATLDAFFRNAPAAMFLKTLDGVYERVNAHTRTLLGRPADDVVGRKVEELLTPESAKSVADVDALVIATGAPQFVQQTYDTGERVTQTITTRFPVRDASGEITHVGVVAIDIDDRIEMETRLRDSEARLTAFLDHAPAAMYLKDQDDRYALVNRFLAGRFSRSPADLIGARPTELLDAAAAAEAAEIDRTIRETGESVVRESEFETDIGPRSALSIRFPVFDEDGAIRYIGGVILDTTDRTEAERKLRESEARLAAFLQNAPVTMFLKDSEGRYVLANQQAATNLGCTVEDLIGKTVAEVAQPELAEAALRLEREVLMTGRPRTDEQVFDLATGRVYGLNTRFPVPNAAGELTQIGGIFVDISAQKRAEAELARSREALLQSEKLTALGSLLAGVSHELNNPLAVVVGESILLEEDAEGTEFAATAGRIRRSAERCSKIVQTFLAMARQKKPERTDLDIEAVATAAIELTDYSMRSNGVRVITDFAPDMPRVSADADQIHQLLVNLLINAQQVLQEQPQPREIRIGTHYDPAKDRICMSVSDNGPGVPPAIANRIFEPFFTTKPQGVGTGIGLSFSHGVAEAHGGKLRLEQGGPGATFVLELPVHSGAEEHADASKPAVPAGVGAGKALIVDDEPEIADALARFIGREGYSAVVVNSGRQAMAEAEAQEYDVILSDLRMPDVDGRAFLDWLQTNRPSLADRLAFITGDTMSPAALEFLERSGRPFLEKPFTRESIRDLLARLAS